MEPVDILRAARVLIADPRRFTPSGPALTEAGWIALPSSANAVRWSAFGAIAAVNNGQVNGEADQALRDAIAEAFSPKNLASLLDHATSLAALDRAVLKVTACPSRSSRSVLARAEEQRRANPPPFQGHVVWDKLATGVQAEIGALALDYAAAFNAVDGTALSETRRRVAEDKLFGAILGAVPIEEWRDYNGRVRVPPCFGGSL